MKKKLAVLAAGVLFLSAAGGCGKENVENVIQDMRKNVEEVHSAMGDVNMDIGVSVGQSGISMGLDLGMEGDWEAVSDPGAFHYNGTINMSLLKFSMDMELYGVEEDDKMILYAKIGDEWNKSETQLKKPKDDEAVKAAAEDNTDKFILDEKTEKVNGKDAYVLRSTITGEDLKKTLGSVEEIKEEDLQKINLDELEVEMVLKVFKDDKLPAAFNIELKDGLKNLMAESGADVPEVGIDKLNFTANIKEYNNIDKIQVPQEALEAENASNEELIEDFQKGLTGQETDESLTDDGAGTLLDEPQAGEEQNASPEMDEKQKDSAETDEGHASPEMDEPQDGSAQTDEGNSGLNGDNEPVQKADGSYVLTDYADELTVDIKVPKGFRADYMDKRYFSFVKETVNADDNYVSASYSIVGIDEYYTEDDYAENILSQQDNYEEYGYKFLKCDGPGKVTVDGREISYIEVQYSFSEDSENAQIIFWTKLDDNHLLECTMAEGIFGKSATLKADEETARTMFSGVSFENVAGSASEKNVVGGASVA